MKSLKPKYFKTKSDKWESLSDQYRHKIRYNGTYCFYDGYYITDENNKIVCNMENIIRDTKEGEIFKILSVINKASGEKNYLGKNIENKYIKTFAEHQIELIENEK